MTDRHSENESHPRRDSRSLRNEATTMHGDRRDDYELAHQNSDRQTRSSIRHNNHTTSVPGRLRMPTSAPNQRVMQQQQAESQGVRGWSRSLFNGWGGSPKAAEPDGYEELELRLAKAESAREDAEDKHHRVQKFLQTSKQQNQNLRKQIKRSEEALEEQAEDSRREREDDNAEFRRAFRAEQNYLNKIIDDLDKKLELAEKKHVSDMKRVEDQAVRQVQVAEKRCREYEQRAEDLETTVRGLQAARLQAVEPTKWAPISNADIEHRLKSIRSALRQWSQNHVKLTINEVLEKFQSLSDVLVGLNCLQENATPMLWDALCKNKAMQKPGKAAALMVSAAASTFIFQEIVGDPFFAFAGLAEEKELLWDAHAETLHTLTGMIGLRDESGAEAWRCQLLRLLDPAIVEKNCKAAAWRTVAEFFTLFDIDTAQEANVQMQVELGEIAQQAATLAWEVWTRKGRLEVHNWPGMSQEDGEIIFSSSSTHLEHHPLHSRELDGDPTTLDGQQVILLCNPLVVMAGTAEGEHYDKQKVLSKAVAWMG